MAAVIIKGERSKANPREKKNCCRMMHNLVSQKQNNLVHLMPKLQMIVMHIYISNKTIQFSFFSFGAAVNNTIEKSTIATSFVYAYDAKRQHMISEELSYCVQLEFSQLRSDKASYIQKRQKWLWAKKLSCREKNSEMSHRLLFEHLML